MTPTSNSETWKEFRGTDPETLALPDYKSIYYAYGFDWKKNPNLGLRITGEFGYARYMSYNIYREVQGKTLGALMDINIEPLPGNVNPFKPNIPPNAPNRQYAVYVFCPDNASPALQAQPNKLNFDSGKDMTLLVVILRYYLPMDDRAGVELPVIEAFDARYGIPLELPPNTVPQRMPTFIFEEQMAPIFETVVDNTLRFYHVEGGGEFDNKDNLYLLNGVQKQAGEVLLLKFQAPSYGLNNPECPDPDVRYWSFNEGNADTSTPWGTPDQDFLVAKDGLTYIAIGDIAIKDWANQGGYNFMPWLAKSQQAVVIYRNLVTNENFEGNIIKVDVLSGLKRDPIKDSSDPRIYNCDASNYIGSYAPTGIKVTQDEFMKNYGGMPSPGFKVPG